MIEHQRRVALQVANLATPLLKFLKTEISWIFIMLRNTREKIRKISKSRVRSNKSTAEDSLLLTIDGDAEEDARLC